MGEVTPGTSITREISPLQPPAVALKNNRLGHLYNIPGQEFKLKRMFGSQELQEERVPEAYIRTKSGALYRLDTEGNLERKASDGRNKKGQIPPEYIRGWSAIDLVVGRPIPPSIFVVFGSVQSSSDITEIIPITDISYAPDELARITQGRKSTIIEDFESLVQAST